MIPFRKVRFGGGTWRKDKIVVPDPDQAARLEQLQHNANYALWYRGVIKQLEADKKAKAREQLAKAIEQCK